MSRFDYVKYDAISQDQQESFKQQAIALESQLDCYPDSREKSLALTALEEFYMWTGKLIRNNQIIRRVPAPLQEDRKNG